MSLETSALGRERVARAIECVSCGQTGSVDCGTIDVPDCNGDVRSILIGISDGFYQTPGAGKPDDPQIICNRCGAVQRDCLTLSL